MDTKEPLTNEAIETKLRDLPGWSFEDDKIKKEFKFPDFLTAIDFINRLSPFFQENDHHPDMHISYNRIKFELQRFDIGGKVTELDFIVASKIEESFKGLA